MAIGMTYREYWYATPSLVVAYRDAHTLKTRMRNEELWLQGAYVYNAFSSVMDAFAHALGGSKGTKPKGYMDKPINITPKTQAEKQRDAEIEREKAIRSLNAWANAWRKTYGNS